MTRWLEQNIGCMALSKDEMSAVRQAQRLYHVAWKDTGEIAEELGISEARVSRYVRYNTHFLGAVSYTHLDVYKRQLWVVGLSAMTSNPPRAPLPSLRSTLLPLTPTRSM